MLVGVLNITYGVCEVLLTHFSETNILQEPQLTSIWFQWVRYIVLLLWHFIIPKDNALDLSVAPFHKTVQSELYKPIGDSDSSRIQPESVLHL